MSCVNTLNKLTLDRKEYKHRMAAAEVIMRNRDGKEPQWNSFDKTMLKCLLIVAHNEVSRITNDNKKLLKPIKRYTLNQLLCTIKIAWSELLVLDVENQKQDGCAICLECITVEVPTITLLCKHRFCTNCFIHATRHGLMNCPLCRAEI